MSKKTKVPNFLRRGVHHVTCPFDPSTFPLAFFSNFYMFDGYIYLYRLCIVSMLLCPFKRLDLLRSTWMDRRSF